MRIIADLHINSRFSRACSKELNIPNLDHWAKIKGLNVLGTGDFTHPQWLAELKRDLVPAENGLFIFKDHQKVATKPYLPAGKAGTLNPIPYVRFMLTTELSCIYKEGGKVRRVHHVVLVPSFDAADKIVAALSKRGCNLKSDGRPILGLNSKDLLEIVLESDSESMLIPAHAWTPWFAIFGSKSGFDSIEECFGNLSKHIYAIETGLSSDPPMNWRLSALDSVALVSNSDAHSLPNIGREANELELSELTFNNIMQAIKNSAPVNLSKYKSDAKCHPGHRSGIHLPAGKAGILNQVQDDKCSWALPRITRTIEFYPEEGMYHFDGHRACDVRWSPKDTKKHAGRCSRCGLPVTVGVLSRVDELADRAEGFKPEGAPGFVRLVELDKIIAEANNVVGRKSKKVQAEFDKLIKFFGGELSILLEIPLEKLQVAASPRVVEGIRRVRAELLTINPGYDGSYGKISIFSDEEKKKNESRAQHLL